LLIERRHLVSALASSVEQLEELNTAKERFIATVSHDLRAPLAAIRGYAEALRRPELAERPENVALSSGAIVRNSERLSRMIEDLLAAGQFALGGHPSITPTSVELLTLTTDLVRDMGSNAVVDGDAVLVHADAGRVQQVVANLVGNAMAHGGEEPNVRVHVTRAGDHAELSVADDGPGIAPEFTERIFQPFTTFGGRPASIGLGLYIARMLARAMSGDVTVSSSGRGATFTVTLPLAAQRAPDGAPPAVPAVDLPAR
jgi:signal transduction histidine kinase